MKFTALLVLMIFFYSGLGHGLNKKESNFENRLNEYVDRVMKIYDVPGVAVGVVKDGRIVFKKGYGKANQETGQTVNTATLFALASVSKSFTATAVMQLVDKGLIRLDDPVVKHVPYFRLNNDNRYRSITVRMLLNHTSGIPTMYKAEFGYENPEFDAQALKRHIQKLSNKSMEFNPGEKHAYSNRGYALLAALIENVSKIPFEQYMEKYVLEPIGMKQSGFFFPDLKKSNIASPHVLGDGFRYTANSYFPVNRWSASCGGLFSNIDEMCNWLLVSLKKGVFIKNRILTEKRYKQMWTVSSQKNNRMGLGWFVDKWLGTTLISHPGGGLGYSAECCLLPEHNLGVVVLCNARKSPVWNITSTAFRLMLGNKVPEVSIPLNIQMQQMLRDKGIDAAIRFYRQKRKELSPDEFWLNQLLILGHRIMKGKHPGKLEIARKILELNAEFFPEEGYAHDMLAEAYLKLALKHYRKAVELDSTNWGAREMIERLNQPKTKDK